MECPWISSHVQPLFPGQDIHSSHSFTSNYSSTENTTKHTTLTPDLYSNSLISPQATAALCIQQSKGELGYCGSFLTHPIQPQSTHMYHRKQDKEAQVLVSFQNKKSKGKHSAPIQRIPQQEPLGLVTKALPIQHCGTQLESFQVAIRASPRVSPLVHDRRRAGLRRWMRPIVSPAAPVNLQVDFTSFTRSASR